MPRKPDSNKHQVHCFIPKSDWDIIKQYCARSGRTIYATQYFTHLVAAFASICRDRMAEGEFASELDFVQIPKLVQKLVDDLETP